MTSQGHLVKFYFCEACGTRLTEHDIDAGAARNKKLKGVYCKDCGEGVTTLDTMPLTNEQAHKIVDASKGTARSTPGGVKRRSSAISIPAAQRKTGQSARARPKSSASNMPIALGGAGAAAVLIVALLLIFRSPSNPNAPGATKRASETALEQTPPVTASTKSISEKSAEKKPVRHTISTPVPKPKSVQTTEADLPVKPVPDPSSAATSDAKVDPAPKTNGAVDPNPTPRPKPKAIVEKPEPKPDPKPDWQGIFDQRLEALMPAIAGEDWPTFSKSVNKLKADASLKGAEAAINALEGAAKAFQVRGAERLKALEKQKDKILQVVTTGGRKKGRLLSVDENKLRLQPEFMISGVAKKGTPFDVPIRSLTPEAWSRIYKPPAPASRSDFTNEALLAMAHGRHNEAGKHLGQAKQSDLAESLRRLRAEASARAAWGELEKQATGKIDEKAAVNWLADFKAHVKKHGNTRYAKAPEQVQLRTKLQTRVDGILRKIRNLPPPESQLRPDLLCTFYTDYGTSAQKVVLQKKERSISLNLKKRNPLPKMDPSLLTVVWTGFIKINTPGNYRFFFSSSSPEAELSVGDHVFKRKGDASRMVTFKAGLHRVRFLLKKPQTKGSTAVSWTQDEGDPKGKHINKLDTFHKPPEKP